LRVAVARDEAALVERFRARADPLDARLLAIAATDAAAVELFDALQAEDLRPTVAPALESLPADRLGRLALARLDRLDPDAETTVLDLLPPLADRTAIDRIVRRLGAEDSEVRAAAADALGRSDPGLVRAALAGAIGDRRLRAGVAHTYGRLGPDGCATLLEFLADRDPEVRAAAADALGRCGVSVTEALRESLRTESEDAVRQALITALGRIGDEEGIATIAASLKEGSPTVRFAAARALGQLGSAGAFEPLIRALEDPLPEIRIAALRSLGELGDSRASPVVARHLAHESREIRRTAAIALDDLGDPAALRRLRAALADPDREVRLTAIDTLRRIGGAAALASLEARANDEPDPVVRSALTRVVLDLREAQIEPPA
jgi:HEAT repeat protein